MKRILLVIIATLLLLPTTSFAQSRTPEVYIALGDSIAAGQTPYRAIDTGYTDLIAMRLKSQGQLSSYTKQLAFPGYTVDDVLDRVQTEEAKKLLSSATLITISAGANDLLRLVQSNPNAGTLTFSQLAADFALNNARKKMGILLEEVKTLAPQAEIFVVGYFFPFVNAHESQQQGTVGQLELLNAILQQEAERAGATFVPVYEDFLLDAKSYLPNIADVHPNIEGYRVIANAFLEKYYGTETMAIASNELPKPNPLTFEQLIKMQQQQNDKQRQQSANVSKTNAKPLTAYVQLYGYSRMLLL